MFKAVGAWCRGRGPVIIGFLGSQLTSVPFPLRSTVSKYQKSTGRALPLPSLQHSQLPTSSSNYLRHELQSTTTCNRNKPVFQRSTAHETYANHSFIIIPRRGPPWRINPSSESRRHVCRLTAGSHGSALDHDLCLQPTHANYTSQELSDIQKNSDLCTHKILAHSILLC